jgi:hypothetical protein
VATEKAKLIWWVLVYVGGFVPLPRMKTVNDTFTVFGWKTPTKTHQHPPRQSSAAWW